MNALTGIKEKIKQFYAKYSNVLLIGGRFLLAVFTFLSINRAIGFSPVFTNIFVILIMALLSSILNTNVLIFFAALTILGNTYVIGWDIFALTAVVMLLVLVMFIWFVPDDAIEVVLMPLSMSLGLPALVPICCGLKRTPASVAALFPGVILHYYLKTLGEHAEEIALIAKNDFMARLKVLTDALLGDMTIIMNLFAVTAVVIIVYAIRKLSASHSWEVAVAAGGVMYIVMALISKQALGADAGITSIVTGTLISVVLAYVFLFFTHHMDYRASEHLTFEDEEYYYYVKAVPKVLGIEEEETESKPEGTQELPAIPSLGEGTGEPTGEVDFGKRLEESLGDL